MKTLGIFTYPIEGVGTWDPDSIQQGIMGSEEAVIYMAKELADLGYLVTVFGNPPNASPSNQQEANPRYVTLHHPIEKAFDVAIAWRWPDLGALLRAKKAAKQIHLWPHDTLEHSLKHVDFDGVLWLSQWQQKQWCSVSPCFQPYKMIFGNGIDAKQFVLPKQRENPYSCIYGSNYGRGLEHLLEIWPEVHKAYPKATLDLYYGWQHWGLLSMEKEKMMRRQIKALECVTDHGKVGHLELSRAYQTASFWIYPCTKPETFCITALKAQMGGAIPVILEGSALSETVQFGYRCQILEEYLDLLLSAMGQIEKVELRALQSMALDVVHKWSWKQKALEWHCFFERFFV